MKYILAIGIVLVLIAVLYFSYTKLLKKPEEPRIKADINDSGKKLECINMQQKYGIIPGVSWGTADTKTIVTWKSMNCVGLPLVGVVLPKRSQSSAIEVISSNTSNSTN